MQRYNILWADDEIDLLKPHILFLEDKGYDITPVNSGADAIEEFREKSFDIVFLDENMPGISGLETLNELKIIRPSVPVIMITKSEEEHIMEEAIGSKITDYLIKPLNPNQILLSVKKVLDNKRLVSEKTNMSYQRDFRQLGMAFGERLSPGEWADIYKKLVFWELEIDETENKSMADVINMQKDEANSNFARFIMDNYEDWINGDSDDAPLMSHQLFKERVFPMMKESNRPVFFVLIDNLRYDQWKILEPLISEYFTVDSEEMFYSILPTTTAYARNAIFSGMLPTDIAKKYPNMWVSDDEEEGKNLHEADFLDIQFQQNKVTDKHSYHKITNVQAGRDLLNKFSNLDSNKLNVIVYNFVDMLSHARTDSNMVRELAPDESAYRSITRSWFLHSPLYDTLKMIADKKGKLIITTDHGTIRVKRPFKIIGDRNTNTNLRYKHGKNLGYTDKDVFTVRKPERFFLPKANVSTTFVFAIEDYFFAYPNNYNYYVNYYKDTFQHGGVSLEECIIPYVTLSPKNV
ncbi:T9SS response regulator signal transducer PorX [Pontibacter cellulosilyticus]|uniref:Bifunctional response regulator/alkaline phosphatase family protein n=1 Tax=Pontibacter cellulosilyticus TaxID=1720253 RepID=A0A923N653_9BACT|nr:bifunctional response regulator/alkaline phosphatase family protein [Pontibacter cellulosilyticus]MBC5993343.1 bifunctional response regulator/alkaline phosphatase family protein [Pontibacter cellulosilyticus]